MLGSDIPSIDQDAIRAPKYQCPATGLFLRVRGVEHFFLFVFSCQPGVLQDTIILLILR
jgi:hypothetical protein